MDTSNIPLHLIPDGTAFASKTHDFGRKTRFEVRRYLYDASHGNSHTSVYVPSDQPTRKGNVWAYDTRDAAERRCFQINMERARKLLALREIRIEGTSFKSPAHYETHAHKLLEEGDLEAAAQCFILAKCASIGHNRRDRYEAQADQLRELDLKRSRGEV